jgi:uncharacterized protein YyaL (SSP411 family)
MGFISRKKWPGFAAAIAVLVIGIIAFFNWPGSLSKNSLQETGNERLDFTQPTGGIPTDRPSLTRDDDSGNKPNRLIHEKSPYLLQHADNPVDWYPWGEEALEKARQEDKPIFLSIGYSTCHWCHVMEQESFRDPEVARLMNETFVSIIVDREERPDIDNYYMNVAAVLSGSGGWPLTILMTPDQKPFYATTYIPRESRFGRTGMLALIPQVRQAWLSQDPDLLNVGDQVDRLVDEALNASAAGKLEVDEALLERTFQELAAEYDAQNGGFGEGAKFPTAHRLLFLLRYWERFGDDAALQMVESTLQAMRRGGIYDQIGSGFHRYATDAEWLAPHFEKMLYDQALLALAYSEAYQATGNQEYEQVAREIFTYILRDMTDPKGGFYSAEDADSEGIEGKFYLWTTDEIRQVLSEEDAELAITAFNATEAGNFSDPGVGEGAQKNILYLARPMPELAGEFGLSEQALVQRFESVREQLYAGRASRIHPHKDDKVLTDWNGLMIAALARGSQVFNDVTYSDAARRAADFIWQTMRDGDGRLLHRYRDGEPAVQGTIDDYAFLIWGLLELYETTFDSQYLENALELADQAMTHYWDEEDGGFYFTPDDGEDVIGRQKLIHDGDIPSGNSIMMLNLIRLGRLTADPDFDERAMAIGHAFAEYIQQEPSAYTQLMSGLDFGLGPSYEVVIIGEKNAKDTQAMLAALRAEFIPNKVVLLIPPQGSSEISGLAEYTKYYSTRNNKATAYVCQNFYCELPTNDTDQMLAFLGKQ